MECGRLREERGLRAMAEGGVGDEDSGSGRGGGGSSGRGGAGVSSTDDEHGGRDGGAARAWEAFPRCKGSRQTRPGERIWRRPWMRAENARVQRRRTRGCVGVSVRWGAIQHPHYDMQYVQCSKTRVDWRQCFCTLQ